MAKSSDTQPSCQTDSGFKRNKDLGTTLGGLKGTIAISGKIGCSGALVTFKGRSSAAPALVLSAAHCSDRGSLQLPLGGSNTLAILDVGEVLVGVEYQGQLTLGTGNNEAPRAPIQPNLIVYATLTEADIMLLRLVETYDEIERRTGVRPFIVSEETSVPSGAALRLPSGYWQDDRVCELEEIVQTVKEHRWRWSNVMRLRRLDPDTCLTPGGVSGAPLIRTDNNEVVGVLGTSNDASGTPCALHNPCEVGVDGSAVALAKDQSYVHSVHRLYSCLDAERNFDIATAGCLLPKPQPSK